MSNLCSFFFFMHANATFFFSCNMFGLEKCYCRKIEWDAMRIWIWINRNVLLLVALVARRDLEIASLRAEKFDIKWMVNAYGCRRLCRQIQCQIVQCALSWPRIRASLRTSTPAALAKTNALQYCKTFGFHLSPKIRILVANHGLICTKCNSINTYRPAIWISVSFSNFHQL